MRAIRTDTQNLLLTLDKDRPETNLPAQQIKAFNPEIGETPDDAVPAIETTWMPDEGELRALSNGAPVILTVTGEAHPPVSMEVGEPGDGAVAVLVKAHVDRAVGFWFSELSKAMERDGKMPEAPEVLELWHKALEHTREGQPLDLGEELASLEKRLNGDGAIDGEVVGEEDVDEEGEAK